MKKLGAAITAALMLFVLLVGVLPGQAQEYLLGVGDVLRISVWGHAELTTEVAVRPDGYLTFPLVGDHMAVGKSARQLSQELEAILADYVVNPRVTVIVSQFRSLQVQVLGEVKSSGYYQLRAGARLMDILALAGGPTQAADLQQISITRYYLDNSGVERTEVRSEEHTSELQSRPHLVCRLLHEKKNDSLADALGASLRACSV